jgi:aminoglycoside phosphotransferase (APT) family kinase protein
MRSKYAPQVYANNCDGSNQIDVRKLEDYLATRVMGFTRPLTVKQFMNGASNPTYLLTDGHAAQYVLRKKPPGTLLSASAHNVEREFRVMEALGGSTDVPVPRLYLLCRDSDILGTPFYVSEDLCCSPNEVLLI